MASWNILLQVLYFKYISLFLIFRYPLYHHHNSDGHADHRDAGETAGEEGEDGGGRGAKTRPTACGGSGRGERVARAPVGTRQVEAAEEQRGLIKIVSVGWLEADLIGFLWNFRFFFYLFVLKIQCLVGLSSVFSWIFVLIMQKLHTKSKNFFVSPILVCWLTV